jgi:hypothetical protein
LIQQRLLFFLLSLISISIYTHCIGEMLPAKTNKRRPLTAQCSIRFKGDVSSKSELESLGRKIKSIFGTPLFHFTKGRQKYTYYDSENGIKLDGFFSSESDADSLFGKILDIQTGLTYHSSYLSVGTRPNFDWTPNDPETIAGKTVKSPQLRVPGEVYFTHAELKHKKLKEDITLYAAAPQRRRQSLI